MSSNPQNKKLVATFVMVVIPLLIVILGGLYVFLNWKDNQEVSEEADSVPDAYSEKTYDHVPDPMESRTCVQDMSIYDLLKDSENLKAAHIKVWIGGSFDNGLKVPKACASKEKGPFSVITLAGISSVVENPDSSESSALEWECGGQVPAQKYLFKGDENHSEALFLVSGENSEKLLQWHPAKAITDSKSCGSADPDYEISENSSYEIPDLKLKYAVQHWKVKSREDEVCSVAVASLHRLILDQKNSCERQLEAQLNCDGLQGSDEPIVSKVLGVLTIKGESAVENWLIFESPGYEWQGYSVAPIDGLGRLDKKRLKTLIYSGC